MMGMPQEGGVERRASRAIEHSIALRVVFSDGGAQVFPRCGSARVRAEIGAA